MSHRRWLGPFLFIGAAMAVFVGVSATDTEVAQAAKPKAKPAAAAKPAAPLPAPTAAPPPKADPGWTWVQTAAGHDASGGELCTGHYTNEDAPPGERNRECRNTDVCCRTNQPGTRGSRQVECTDIKSDSKHCGGCGRVCPKGELCINGLCGRKPGDILCNGQWVNSIANVDNCGSCGNRCAQFCSEGKCHGCEKGKTFCESAPSYCANLKNDETDCGKCGHECPSGWQCKSGRCLP